MVDWSLPQISACGLQTFLKSWYPSTFKDTVELGVSLLSQSCAKLILENFVTVCVVLWLQTDGAPEYRWSCRNYVIRIYKWV